MHHKITAFTHAGECTPETAQSDWVLHGDAMSHSRENTHAAEDDDGEGEGVQRPEPLGAGTAEKNVQPSSVLPYSEPHQ